MKRLCFLVICMSIIMGCSTSTSSTKALVDYVDPNKGGETMRVKVRSV